MEYVGRDKELARKRGPEGDLERKQRLRGGHAEPRLIGVRRIPRNLWGGALGMFVLVIFFWGLAGYSANFLVGFAVIVGVGAFSVWALTKLPHRATFDQRWKPHRRIDPLDTTAWSSAAEEIGADFSAGRLPRMDGRLGGVDYTVEFVQQGGARTVATARLAEPAAAPLRLFPRLAEFKTRETQRTGDDAFDDAWHATCADRATALRLLPPAARRWIVAAEPEEVTAEGGTVTARRTGFVSDEDRLLGLIHTVVSMGGGGGP